MTKELSKQLCELCGVEPKCCENNQYCGRFIKKEGCIFNRTKKSNKDCKYLKYPDFGQPENFVKLLNIKAELNDDSPTLFNFITNYYHEKYATVEVNYLYSLICLLTDSVIHKDYLRPTKWKNIVKQAIREAEWKYE